MASSTPDPPTSTPPVPRFQASLSMVAESITPHPRKLQHLKEGAKPTMSGLFGNVYGAPWPGGDLTKGFVDVLKWQCSTETKKPAFPTPGEAAKLVPSVDKVDEARLFDFGPDVASNVNDVQATWMGHASFLVQIGGVNILTDPVWSDRASPVQFAGPLRYVPPPMAIEKLPPIHIVTISHNHYDHLCFETVKRLKKAFDPIFVVPKGMKSRWFDSVFDVETGKRVKELMWWEEVDLCFNVSRTPKDNGRSNAPDAASASSASATAVDNDDDTVEVQQKNKEEQPTDQLQSSSSAPSICHRTTVTITSTPVQHWTMREGPWDRNKELWCGFVYDVVLRDAVDDKKVVAPRRLCYHSGDTGYCNQFKETGIEFCGPAAAAPVADATRSGVGKATGSREGTDRADTKKEEKVSSSSSSAAAKSDTIPESNLKDDTDQHQEGVQNDAPASSLSSSKRQFDLAMLPIGAYHPRWFLSVQHVDPAEAVQIHFDLQRPRLSLGMHWGTFILTDEPLDEPPKLLRAAMQDKGAPPDGEFVALKHGETVSV